MNRSGMIIFLVLQYIIALMGYTMAIVMLVPFGLSGGDLLVFTNTFIGIQIGLLTIPNILNRIKRRKTNKVLGMK